MEKNEALDAITDYKIAVTRAENDLRHTVAVARLAGASWTEIGIQLAITRQAAQQRFSDAKPNTYRCNCGWSNVIPVDAEGCRRETRVVLDHIEANHPELMK